MRLITTAFLRFMAALCVAAFGVSLFLSPTVEAREAGGLPAPTLAPISTPDLSYDARGPPYADGHVASTGVSAVHGGMKVAAFGSDVGWFGAADLAVSVATNTTRLTVADFPKVRTTVSQKQNRHIEGRPEYRGGGTLSSQADAQRVLDAYHSGDAVILGQTSQGFPVVRFNGVTGTNNNVGAGITNQPTNVFIVKGTASPSIVPANPNWTP